MAGNPPPKGSIGNVINYEALNGLLVRYEGILNGCHWFKSLEPKRFDGDLPGEAFAWDLENISWIGE